MLEGDSFLKRYFLNKYFLTWLKYVSIGELFWDKKKKPNNYIITEVAKLPLRGFISCIITSKYLYMLWFCSRDH